MKGTEKQTLDVLGQVCPDPLVLTKKGCHFCFPGYYPGDLDDEGNALFNCCDTGEYYYGKIVEAVLSRARKVFDMEVTTSVEKQWQFHQTA